MVDANYFIVTDIEGVAGIDSFATTRTSDPDRKAPAMDRLAAEVDACVHGIRDVQPDAEIVVWDGHGTGGLREEDVSDATYVREGRPYFDLEGVEGQLFVGQHAMAGMPFAPLRHTYSSRHVESYRLNGTFMGEFSCRALVAGAQHVSTIFLSGDDKACLEARMFVPEIETAAVKRGTGEEAAVHDDPVVAEAAIREGAARAVERREEIPALTGFEPPYTLDVRRYDPIEEVPDGATRVDAHTVRYEGDDLLAAPFTRIF